MTPPNPPDRPGPWPDVLAAYADGELDADTTAAVERWLAAHPGAREELRAQRDLSPANRRLWQQAEPPHPSKDAWAAVQRAVSDGVFATPVTPTAPRLPSSVWWKRPGVWVGTAAAVVGFSVLVAMWLNAGAGVNLSPGGSGRQPEFAEPNRTDDPLAEFAVLPVAAPDDVDIRQVAGNAGGSLVVGALLLPPGPLVLAEEDDVELQDAEPHPAWPAGGPQITTAPGDAPMIFAAPPRKGR